MFERFDRESRAVVMLAREEARGMHHPSVGTEHLLLGLLGQSEDPVARALGDRGLRTADVRARIVRLVGPTAPPGGALDEEALAVLGIDLDAVRRATEASFGPGALDPKPKPASGGHLPFGKPAKKVLELSLREALHLKQNHIGTGHILLGLLREGEGLATVILLESGIDPVALRTDITDLITAEAA